jgi:hypothetical protein
MNYDRNHSLLLFIYDTLKIQGLGEFSIWYSFRHKSGSLCIEFTGGLQNEKTDRILCPNGHMGYGMTKEEAFYIE